MKSKEHNMHPIRRIVTSLDPAGKSVFKSDGPATRETSFKHVPGFVTSLLWETPPNASVQMVEGDPAALSSSWTPAPGTPSSSRPT